MTSSSRNWSRAVRMATKFEADGAASEAAAERGETVRVIRLSDIRVHDMDVSIPNEKQARVYAGLASGSGRKTMPPVRVGYWVDADMQVGYESAGIPDDRSGNDGLVPKSRGGGSKKRASSADVREIVEYIPTYYLLADGDIYRGCLRAGGVREIECVVTECGSEADFLTKHALANQRYAGYNPLKVGRIVRWLQTVSRGGEADDGTGRTISRAEAEAARRAVEDVMRACRDTVDQKFINLHLVDEAANVVSGMCEWLGGRLSRFELPYYIPYRISKAPPGVQAELAKQISSIVRSGNMTDAKFAWPAPEEIEVMSDTPAFRGESEPALGDESGGATIAVPEGEEEDHAHAFAGGGGGDGRAGRGRSQDGGGDISVNDAKAAAARRLDAKAAASTPPARTGKQPSDGRLALQNTRDVIIIPGTKKHPTYVVDLKTRRVSVADDHQKVTVLREVSDASRRKGAYLLPVQVCEWLGLPGTAAAAAASRDGNDADSPTDGSVRLHMFSSQAGLAKFARQQERESGRHNGRSSRGVIIYT
ncbi:MAG: hypothetical protein J4F28_08165 [Nitrosopumilaceae archaeon]|nr:hypothetical protein [Nitrosopumilaceae archaeon]